MSLILKPSVDLGPCQLTNGEVNVFFRPFDLTFHETINETLSIEKILPFSEAFCTTNGVLGRVDGSEVEEIDLDLSDREIMQVRALNLQFGWTMLLFFAQHSVIENSHTYYFPP